MRTVDDVVTSAASPLPRSPPATLPAFPTSPVGILDRRARTLPYDATVSIAVELDDLPAKTAEFRWAYLLTVRDDQRPHVVAVTPAWKGESLVVSVGRGTAANAATRSTLTLCYPPPDLTGLSLVIDGEATVDGEIVTIRPTGAVLHRPAPPPA